MEATKLLKKDHDTVRDLFKQYEKAGDKAFQTKKGIFEQVKTELEIHATIEEEIFYPAARRAGIDSDLLDEADIDARERQFTRQRQPGGAATDDDYLMAGHDSLPVLSLPSQRKREPAG